MKNSNFSVYVFVMFFLAMASYGLDEQYCGKVQGFIDAVRSGDKYVVADYISFPLGREYPIPPIRNRDEFVERYEEVFDTDLIQIISNSDAENDWNLVGWRGIMINSGLVWMHEYGNVFVINYQSETEKVLREELINMERNELYPTLRNYLEPVIHFRTKSYMVRIDKIDDSTFRYAAWPSSKTQLDEPDLILSNGTVTYQGSGGNHYYEFTNDIYTYRFEEELLGSAQSMSDKLIVYMDAEEILSEDVIEFLEPLFWND